MSCSVQAITQEGVILHVLSMHGWKDDVISDNFYVGQMP
jgi:hypothetical protein